jgi:outer membrane protein assembly factor BamA
VALREERASADCAQPAAEQEAIIREADTRRFTLRRIELIGNVSTADDLLHRRIAIRMEEGNLFSRRNLMASLRSVSRLKTIYPVTMRDVVARLDQAEKTLDLRICINERSRPVRRAS